MNDKKEKDKTKQTSYDAVGVAIGGVSAMNTEAKNLNCDNECNAYCDTLRAKVEENQSALNARLKADPGYVGDRYKAVKMAYEYEIADAKMSGNGSANWSKSELSELLATGKVRGAEGHHPNDVTNHPEMQADPNNIVFFKDRKSHLYEGHGGNFRNECHGPLIDKEKMLKNTNAKRKIKNDLGGFGLAFGVGAGYGFAKSIYDTCSEDGFSMSSLVKGLKNGVEPALEDGAVAGCAYVLKRCASHAIDWICKKI